MEKLSFDKRIYNEGAGALFTRLMHILWPGFGIGLFIIALNVIWRISIPIPALLLPLLSVYTVLSILGLPLAFYLKRAYAKQLKQSTLSYDGRALIYERPIQRYLVSAGRSEERHLYRIERIDRVKAGRYAYVIEGDIEARVLYGSDAEAPERIYRVKLPRAYAELAQLLADKIIS